MLDMFSLTRSSCLMGAWHIFKPTFIVFKLDFKHGMMTCGDMFDMFSLTWPCCTFSAHFGMTRHVRCVTGNMFIIFACQGQSDKTWHHALNTRGNAAASHHFQIQFISHEQAQKVQKWPMASSQRWQ